MGGGGVRIEETGQPAGRMRGTKGDGCNERHRQMGGGGVRRGNPTTSRTRGLEGQDKWPELSFDTAEGSLMARYGDRWQWTVRWLQRRGTGARRLLDGEEWRDGSSTARDGVRRLLDGKGRREHGGNGQRAQRQWAAMDSAMANGW